MLKNKDLLTLLIRLFLAYTFFSAGICKLTHGNFGQIMGPPWLEERLAEYGLGLFAQVVAVSQVIIGLLLFSQRFSLLGAIMLVPMNVAILAVTVSQQWVGTPSLNVVFLTLNLLLLGLEHKKFRFLFFASRTFQIKPSSIDHIGQNLFSWVGIGFALATLFSAPFNILLTNIFAVLTFATFATSIIRSGLENKFDILLLIMPFLAMTVLTLGKVIPSVEIVLLSVLMIEALLLPYRLYLGKSKKPRKVTATAAIG